MPGPNLKISVKHRCRLLARGWRVHLRRIRGDKNRPRHGPSSQPLFIPDHTHNSDAGPLLNGKVHCSAFCFDQIGVDDKDAMVRFSWQGDDDPCGSSYQLLQTSSVGFASAGPPEDRWQINSDSRLLVVVVVVVVVESITRHRVSRDKHRSRPHHPHPLPPFVLFTAIHHWYVDVCTVALPCFCILYGFTSKSKNMQATGTGYIKESGQKAHLFLMHLSHEKDRTLLIPWQRELHIKNRTEEEEEGEEHRKKQRTVETVLT
ncbi:hypothetical protein MUK42_13283 [Musa troglodytarum]|uniref:Uncharacterized protein n=1 Tax=Musa troglodytarum TaxID=320322 RepID=A0A9E7KD66_9LILI|nr:hypothetical protein MUK42_13283 [Musa troglodytarum]